MKLAKVRHQAPSCYLRTDNFIRIPQSYWLFQTTLTSYISETCPIFCSFSSDSAGYVSNRLAQPTLPSVYISIKASPFIQESVCSAFGASIAHGCVVDLGSMKTSVSCVEEGLVLSETRLALDYGGDDVSELYLRLLERINLPYRSADLTRTYDWIMMEDLKFRSASLAEVRLRVQIS